MDAGDAAWEARPNRGRRHRVVVGAAGLTALVVGVALAGGDWPTSRPPPESTGPDQGSLEVAGQPGAEAPAGGEIPEVAVLRGPGPGADEAELPALDEPTGVVLVATALGDRDVTIVDVDAGEAATRDLDDIGARDPVAGFVVDDRFVVSTEERLYTLASGPHGSAELVADVGDIAEAWPAGGTDRVWVRVARGEGAPSRVQQIALDGRVTVEPTQAPTGNVAAGLASHVLLRRGGDLVAWQPGDDDVAVEVSSTVAMAAVGHRFAWCAGESREPACKELHLTDVRGHRDQRVADVADETATFAAYNAAFSPDGRFLATPVCTHPTACSLAVVDVGSRRAWVAAEGLLAQSSGLAWSPDRRWVFAHLTDGQVAAYRPGDDEARRIPVDLGRTGRIHDLGVLDAG